VIFYLLTLFIVCLSLCNENTKLFIYLVPVLLILSFVLCKKALAVTYFSDNFESGNLDQWTHNVGNVGNTSSWYVQDNVLHSRVTKGKHSFLYANVPAIPSNYKFSANVKKYFRC